MPSCSPSCCRSSRSSSRSAPAPRVLAGEEEAGRLELLFAYPLRRRDGVLAKGATVAVEVALFAVAVAAAMLLLDPVFDLGLSASRVAGAAVSLARARAAPRLARACRRRLHPEQGARDRSAGGSRGGGLPRRAGCTTSRAGSTRCATSRASGGSAARRCARASSVSGMLVVAVAAAAALAAAAYLIERRDLKTP